jgi:hypothetical protein
MYNYKVGLILKEVFTRILKGVILKGQYVIKQEQRRRIKTTHNILNKNRPNLLADYYKFK